MMHAVCARRQRDGFTSPHACFARDVVRNTRVARTKQRPSSDFPPRNGSIPHLPPLLLLVARGASARSLGGGWCRLSPIVRPGLPVRSSFAEIRSLRRNHRVLQFWAAS